MTIMAMLVAWGGNVNIQPIIDQCLEVLNLLGAGGESDGDGEGESALAGGGDSGPSSKAKGKSKTPALDSFGRDLTELAEAGKLERVHGGAVLPSGTANIAYEERRRLHADSKTAMAKVCASMIPEDCAIFLNIGTSTEAVAKELLEHRNLLVVKGSVPGKPGALLNIRPAVRVGAKPANGGKK